MSFVMEILMPFLRSIPYYMDSIKDVGRSFLKVPEFDKHLKKAGGHVGRNIVEITIKKKTVVRKSLMIKIIKLRVRNLDNKYRWERLKHPYPTYYRLNCIT